MSIRGKAIRGAGGLLKRNTTLGVGIGHPHGGEEGDIRVQMVDGSPKLYARAGGQWYGINLSSQDSEDLKLGDTSNYINIESGNIEMTGKISLQSSDTKNVCIGVNNSNKGESNVMIGVSAGKNVATADLNTFVGPSAGYYMKGGSKNTAVGPAAMWLAGNYGAIDVNNNTCVGYYAGQDLQAHNNVYVGYGSGLGATNVDGTIGIGLSAGYGTTGNLNTSIGWLSKCLGDHAIAIGSQVTATTNETVIGRRGVFRFKSKQYVCDIADGEDAKSASTDSTPIKLPAYAIIKSISVVVEQLSNLGTYNVALYHSTDAGAVADDTALGGTPVEVLGAGVTATLSGNSASAVDIALGTSTGVAKQTYYMDEGINVGTVDRYIHVGNAGTSNGNTDPSTDGEINVLVEYIGLD